MTMMVLGANAAGGCTSISEEKNAHYDVDQPMKDNDFFSP